MTFMAKTTDGYFNLEASSLQNAIDEVLQEDWITSEEEEENGFEVYILKNSKTVATAYFDGTGGGYACMK